MHSTKHEAQALCRKTNAPLLTTGAEQKSQVPTNQYGKIHHSTARSNAKKANAHSSQAVQKKMQGSYKTLWQNKERLQHITPERNAKHLNKSGINTIIASIMHFVHQHRQLLSQLSCIT